MLKKKKATKVTVTNSGGGLCLSGQTIIPWELMLCRQNSSLPATRNDGFIVPDILLFSCGFTFGD